jgi:hypothetical protein
MSKVRRNCNIFAHLDIFTDLLKPALCVEFLIGIIHHLSHLSSVLRLQPMQAPGRNMLSLLALKSRYPRCIGQTRTGQLPELNQGGILVCQAVYLVHALAANNCCTIQQSSSVNGSHLDFPKMFLYVYPRTRVCTMNTISIKMGKFQVPNFTKWLK